MARLQDFQTVTPTSSDKLLVVQSQGQGLVPYGSKLDSANPTGSGSLAVGYNPTASGNNSTALGASNTASGNYTFAGGYSSTASGNYSHAEGNGTLATQAGAFSCGRATKADGDTSFSMGVGTIANHQAQKVFGTYNIADTSSAQATSKGNYIEIVGNGTGDAAANRSNARTLDWNGNETLAGDLTYNGNVSLTRLLNQYYFKSGSPIVISGLSRYETFIVMGFAQGIGIVVIMVTISAGVLDNPINMKTGTAFSNSHLTFTYSSTSNSLTITSDIASESRLTVIRG